MLYEFLVGIYVVEYCIRVALMACGEHYDFEIAICLGEAFFHKWSDIDPGLDDLASRKSDGKYHIRVI